MNKYNSEQQTGDTGSSIRMRWGLASAILIGFAVNAHAAPFEDPPQLTASTVLPIEILTGPYHRIDERVLNDGYLNHYTIRSQLGDIEVVSTAKLRKRIDEINAIALMEEAKNTETFATAVRDAGGDAIEGIKSLVTSPVETVSGAVSGIGKLFGRGKEALFGSSRSEAEDSRLQPLVGFSKAKREYAHEFGVDAYTHNEILQERLDEISWTGYAGGLSAALLMGQLPGAAGAAITAANATDLLNEALRDLAPADLRKMNREKLTEMGVSEVVAGLFIDNANFTPREQTTMVAALETMSGVSSRGAFVEFAVLADDDDITYFRQRQIQMYAAYHNMIEPILDFVPVGQIAAARVRDGGLLVVVPLDLLVWTAELGSFVTGATDLIQQNYSPSSKQIWLSGQATDLAKKSLVALGWTVEEGAETRLIPEFSY